MGDLMRILLTGGTGGLGKSIIENLCQDNEIIFTYFNNLEEKINLEKKYNIKGFYLNLEDKKSIEDLVNSIDNIDVLINNASVAIDNDYNLKTYEEFKKVIDINLIGTYYLTKLTSKKINKNGNVIFISSTNGIDTPYVESIDYDASKAGIISLMHNFATYLAPNIRVNTIAPGWIDTPMNKTLDSEFKKKEEDKILLGRFAKPDEVAKVVKFLVNATYINDTVIRVDGGIKK